MMVGAEAGDTLLDRYDANDDGNDGAAGWRHNHGD